MLEGTTDNAAGSVSGPTSSTGTTGNVTSGTASEAMIKAATAASSAEAAPAAKTGDTATATGTGESPATAAATGQEQPATGQPDATTSGTRGEAPEARIVAAVKNVREQYERQYAWAKDFKPEDIADIKLSISLVRELRQDARAFHRRLGAELGTSEERPAEEPKEERFPEPDLVSEDGKLKTYSDATLSKIFEIQRRQVMKEVLGELQPMMDFYGTEKEARSQAEVQQQARSTATRELATARELPHFKDNEPAIIEKLTAMDPAQRRANPVAAMYLAYSQVLKEKVFPGYETAAEERVRANFEKKANAGRGQAHPTDQGGEVKKPALRNVDDLARHMERLAGAATS